MNNIEIDYEDSGSGKSMKSTKNVEIATQTLPKPNKEDDTHRRVVSFAPPSDDEVGIPVLEVVQNQEKVHIAL